MNGMVGIQNVKIHTDIHRHETKNRGNALRAFGVPPSAHDQGAVQLPKSNIRYCGNAFLEKYLKNLK